VLAPDLLASLMSRLTSAGPAAAIDVEEKR
jgi:hypothetical protein